MNKNRWRKEFKKKLRSLSQGQLERQSLIIENKLFSYLSGKKGLWTLYFPLRDEPNLLRLPERSVHISWAFPEIQSESKMVFYQVPSTNSPSPQKETVLPVMSEIHRPGEPVPSEEIRGCIIPGLAYDRWGTRLGRGGGHYDRFLKNFFGVRLGVSFNEGLTDETLPRESHDQKMNIIVSPEKWIEFNTPTDEVKNEL